MSAAIVLPFLWATEAVVPIPLEVVPPEAVPARPPVPVAPEIAFYRKYTEGLLRRYVRMSLECGKTPSLLGHEMFRAKVTHYRVESFEDVVIFVHDVERCLEKLELDEQQLVARIALQEYTVLETADLLRMRPRTIVRRYRQAIDHLTRIFLHVEMLHPQKSCQEGKTRLLDLTSSFQTK